MKTHIFLFVLGLNFLLNVDAVCDLSLKKQDVDFPDITKGVADSYIMGVEYSIPKAMQTDYYTEYYEILFKRGRVESHINGKNQTYIYQAETWEAWTLKDKDCTLENTTVTPYFAKDDQTDWRDIQSSGNPTTIGPSAMFKIALAAWKKKTDKTMAYMGEVNGLVRGEVAVYWRRCLPSGGYADYFFADSSEQNAFDPDEPKNLTPLRVIFDGVSPTPDLSAQIYDIISFQSYIPASLKPFELPKGRNCERGQLVDGPVLPDFSSRSLLLSAEVLYQKLNKDDQVTSSYYSTLMFALDVESNHLAYYYSSWNTTKPDPDTKEPFLNAPEYVIYDMAHMYAYKVDLATAKCDVSRSKSFVPQYKLPENGGSLSLTDPYVLFPNKALTFLTEGRNRGLPVNVFETEIQNYLLDKDTVIPRAIVSHSYLKSNAELENSVAVRNAPTQMELHFFRKPDEEEILTLNIFGFTTRIPNRRYLFDVTRCYKNDDDYLYMTIGFEIENQDLSQIEKALPEIESNVVQQIIMKSELNPVRMPSVMTDLRDNYVYVTIVILGKPTLQLDFPYNETGKSIKTSGSEGDSQGVSNFDICANNCIEEKADCWGFSLCGGATCYFGSSSNSQVELNKDCILYRRFSNDSYLLSKESQANNIANQVQAGEFLVTAILGDGTAKTLTATVVDITDPAEDDSTFEKMGNFLNPRMRIVKVAKRLKKGSNVKNLGNLRYDQCQSLCLDYKNCETLSYCLKNSECIISDRYESDLDKDKDMETNNVCIVLARKYADHFDRTPGVFVESEKGVKKSFNKVEDCARACLQEGISKCLSFDHCAEGEQKGCSLYTVHYLNANDRKEAVKGKNARCGHYTRKLSTEFKRKDETCIKGSKIPAIKDLTLEECAKTCVNYDQGTCFGYDFCQDKTLSGTTCTIIDSDPSRLETSHCSTCTNYVRTAEEYAPHPYTTSYAGGIGFLCFIVGGVIGAAIVFGIAYYKANRGMN